MRLKIVKRDVHLKPLSLTGISGILNTAIGVIVNCDAHQMLCSIA